MSAGEDGEEQKWNGKITSCSRAATDKIIHLFVIKKFKKFLPPARIFCILISPNSGGRRLGLEFFRFSLAWKILKLFVSLWENDKWALLFLRRPGPTSSPASAFCWAARSFLLIYSFFAQKLACQTQGRVESNARAILPQQLCVCYPQLIVLWWQTNCSIYEPLVFVNKGGKMISIVSSIFYFKHWKWHQWTILSI